MKTATLEDRILKRIARKRGDVFLREDFSDLSGYDQVGRVLRGLVRRDRLIRIGYGLYARAKASILDGEILPQRGLRTLVEAINRLGIETCQTQMAYDNMMGRTTQVPTGRVVGVRRRIRRKIGYGGIYMGYENARSLPR